MSELSSDNTNTADDLYMTRGKWREYLQQDQEQQPEQKQNFEQE
jgi:hypothetical protein